MRVSFGSLLRHRHKWRLLSALALIYTGMGASVASAHTAIHVNPRGATSTGLSPTILASLNISAIKGSGAANEGLVINPSGTLAYIATADASPGSLVVMNTATLAIKARIPVGNEPVGIAINPAGTLVYVANWLDGTMSVVNTRSDKVTATVTLGPPDTNGIVPTGTYAIAVSPSGKTVYAVNERANTVSVINAATNQIVATVGVGSNPLALAVNPSGTLVFVADSENQGQVSVINTATDKVVNTITVGPVPYGVAFNATGTRAYVSNWGNGTISVINTSTDKVTSQINLGNQSGPEFMALGPDHSTMFVVEELSGAVAQFNTATNQLLSTFHIGGNPAYLAFAGSNTLFVSNQGVGVQVLQYPPPAQTVVANAAPIQLPLNIDNSLQTSRMWFDAINTIPPTVQHFIPSNPTDSPLLICNGTLAGVKVEGLPNGNSPSQNAEGQQHSKAPDKSSSDLFVESADDSADGDVH